MTVIKSGLDRLAFDIADQQKYIEMNRQNRPACFKTDKEFRDYEADVDRHIEEDLLAQPAPYEPDDREDE